MTQACKTAPPSPLKALKAKSKLDALLDAGFFRALGDETRLNLLCCLTKCARACSLSEVAECCNVDMSVVSRHMSMLSQAGLVKKSRSGRHTLYSVQFDSVVQRFFDTGQAFQECAEKRIEDDEGACCG